MVLSRRLLVLEAGEYLECPNANEKNNFSSIIFLKVAGLAFIV
jgi:hypothetical protein